jgi:NAD(P)H-flavin reductase
VRYGCKNGGCGTCKARLLTGQVQERGSSLALSAAEQADGWILLCSCKPLEDCDIDVASMALAEEEFLAGDQPGAFLVEVEHNLSLVPRVRELRLRLIDPVAIRFTAGQFINIEVPGAAAVRSYSIASAPSVMHSIDLLIDVLPGGAFSGALVTGVRPGSRLRLWGPFGQQRVRLSHRPIVMIAGGIGLAPMLSMLAGLAEQKNLRPVTLFFGVPEQTDLFCLERIHHLRAAMPAFQFVPVLTDRWPADWQGETGPITDAVQRRLPNLEGYDAYLSGPAGMIQTGIPMFIERGVRPRNIYYEAFVPTGVDS